MADTKISALTAVGSVAGTEPIPCVSGGATKSATPAQILAYNVAQANTWSAVQTFGDTIVVPKTSGKGIKVDTASPTFGWRDIIGNISLKTTGTGAPTLATYAGGSVRAFAFIANDNVDFVFHMPHDYVPGTDVYFHVHWSHNGTAISGNVVFTMASTWAKGFDQANFPAEKTTTITYNTTNITTTPQYRHRVDEVVISSSGGSASLLDSSAFEVDGLFLINMKVTTLPTITGGSLFVHTCDLHYQSTGIPTKNKAPSFYG